MTKKDEEKILQANDEMTNNALRVLSFAFKELPDAYKKENVEEDLIFIGMIGSIDPPRKEAKESIEHCKQAGIKVVMITGDHKNTAIAIAKDIGLYEKDKAVLTGDELDKISDDELYKLSNDVVIYARVSPKHKIGIINALKANNHVVAMIGDGVNDAPALKKSDIAVAVGTGTDVAKDVSDMILIDDNFKTIVAAVEEGRGIYDNIKRVINYLLSCNFGEILTIFIAILMNLPSPLIPIQILWMNLVTDGLPALALGTSKADPDVMERKPRSKNEKILNIQSLRFIGILGFIMCLGTVYIFVNTFDLGFIKASTMTFTALILVQMVVALVARSERYPFIKTGIRNNKKLLGAIALSILLQIIIIYMPFFNTIFGTTPLNIAEWGIIILFSAIVFAVFEMIKIFRKEFF
jgi:Ca2+-transporting ATPase